MFTDRDTFNKLENIFGVSSFKIVSFYHIKLSDKPLTAQINTFEQTVCVLGICG